MPFRSASTFNRIVPSFTSGARAVSISWRNGTNALLNVEADRGRVDQEDLDDQFRVITSVDITSEQWQSIGHIIGIVYPAQASHHPPEQVLVELDRRHTITSRTTSGGVGRTPTSSTLSGPQIQRDGADMTTLDVIDARQSQGAKHVPQCLTTCVHAQCIVE